ncbi:MAG: MATE family efflux transporter [Filomicrobium sp.]
MPEKRPAGSAQVTHKDVLAIALPIIASNISTPLIGIVDTAVLGQLPGAHHIGGVALGATIFTFLFWAFGFLRMGTTGLTAQAFGADNKGEVGAALERALGIALVAGILLILFHWPLKSLALGFAEGSRAVENETADYFDIRIWSAPAALANYCLVGWFIGLQRARTALALQIFLNGLNAGLDALFVLEFGWGVAGVAWGTLIAEVAAAVVGLVIASRIVDRSFAFPALKQIRDPEQLNRALSVNSDIMIRTLALLAAFSWFTIQSAPAGDATLAANAVLMQLVGFSAHLLDGFAFAAETLVGAAVGAKAKDRFRRAVWLSSIWAALIAIAISAILWLTGGLMIDVLTVNVDVRQFARDALPYAALMPAIGVAAYQLDGIFIGTTRTADMRNMMVVSSAAFFMTWHLAVPVLGNDGRWISLLALNIVRAGLLFWRYPALLADAFPTQAAARPNAPLADR